MLLWRRFATVAPVGTPFTRSYCMLTPSERSKGGYGALFIQLCKRRPAGSFHGPLHLHYSRVTVKAPQPLRCGVSFGLYELTGPHHYVRVRFGATHTEWLMRLPKSACTRLT